MALQASKEGRRHQLERLNQELVKVQAELGAARSMREDLSDPEDEESRAELADLSAVEERLEVRAWYFVFSIPFQDHPPFMKFGSKCCHYEHWEVLMTGPE